MKALIRVAGAVAIAVTVWAGAAFGQATVEMWLPVSCNNEAAVKAYHEAMIRNGHNEDAAYKAKLNESVALAPEAFMPRAMKALWNPAESDAVLAMPVEKLTKAELSMREALLNLKSNPSADLHPVAEKLTADFPNTIEAYMLADHMMFHMADWKGVYKYSKKMTEIDPRFGPGFHWLGYAYLRNDMPEKALETFSQYAAVSPSESKPYEALGETYLVLHNFAKAGEAFDNAALMGRENAKHYAESVKQVLAGLEFNGMQKEVWQAVDKLWMTGSTGNVTEMGALIHDNYAGWNNWSVLIWTKDYFLAMNKDSKYSYKLTPVSVKITGNTAIVDYFMDVTYPNQRIKGQSCDVYIKENGTWMLLGDNTFLEVVKEKQLPI